MTRRSTGGGYSRSSGEGGRGTPGRKNEGEAETARRRRIGREGCCCDAPTGDERGRGRRGKWRGRGERTRGGNKGKAVGSGKPWLEALSSWIEEGGWDRWSAASSTPRDRLMQCISRSNSKDDGRILSRGSRTDEQSSCRSEGERKRRNSNGGERRSNHLQRRSSGSSSGSEEVEEGQEEKQSDGNSRSERTGLRKASRSGFAQNGSSRGSAHLAAVLQNLLLGPRHMQPVRGKLRVSSGNYNAAYLTDERFPHERDIIVRGIAARKRAFYGDDVILKMQHATRWEQVKGKFDSPLFRPHRVGDSLRFKECVKKLRTGDIQRSATVLFIFSRPLSVVEKQLLVPRACGPLLQEGQKQIEGQHQEEELQRRAEEQQLKEEKEHGQQQQEQEEGQQKERLLRDREQKPAAEKENRIVQGSSRSEKRLDKEAVEEEKREEEAWRDLQKQQQQQEDGERAAAEKEVLLAGCPPPAVTGQVELLQQQPCIAWLNKTLMFNRQFACMLRAFAPVRDAKNLQRMFSF